MIGAAIVDSAGPIGPPVHNVIEDAESAPSWAFHPEIYPPYHRAERTTVTIDWRWSQEEIVAAVERLRRLVGTRPWRRAGGIDFWNRYGAIRTVELFDVATAYGSGAGPLSVTAWARAEAARRSANGRLADPDVERITAQKVLGRMRLAVKSAFHGDLSPVLGW